MKSLHLLRPYFAENRHLILLGLLFLTAVDLLQLYIPRIVKKAVDDLTYFKIDISGLLCYALQIVIIAFAIGLLRYGWRRFLLGTSRRVEEGLRNLLSTPALVDMFGDLFLRAYTAVKLDEFEEFNRVISSWEREHLLLNV